MQNDTQQPIEFVNIILQDTFHNKIIAAQISDEKGQFVLNVEQVGNYRLSFSFIGYATWEKVLDLNQSVDLGIITLETASSTLTEVVVTADRPVIERKAGKLIFNVAASPLKSGYDGLELLQRSPNVIVDGGLIMLRNEAATVMINGRILNLSGEDLSNYISNLQSDEIKSIQIQTYRSANTDAESSGGIINIILKKKPIGFDGIIRTDYTFKGEDFKTAFGGLKLNYGATKWNLYGSYNYVHNTNQRVSKNTIDYFTVQNLLRSDEVWENVQNRHNYQFGFVADVAKNHTMGVEGFATNLEYLLDNAGELSLKKQENILEKGATLAESILNNDLYNLTFNYTWNIDTSGSSFKLFADYSNQKLNRNNDVVSIYELGLYENNTERNHSIANTTISALQADWEKFLKQEIKLETGAKWTYTNRENSLFSAFLVQNEWIPNERSTAFNYEEQVAAAYFNLSKTFQEKNFLQVGLRVENTNLERIDLADASTIQQNYTNWFPFFYYSRELPKNHSLSLSYAKRLRRPPFYFLNNNVTKINDFRYELGNPDLVPEQVHQIELSWAHKRQNFAVYYDKVVGAINGIYYLEGDVAYYQKFNSGAQTQFGLDYDYSGNLMKWWLLKATFNLYRRKFTDENGIDSFQRTTGRIHLANTFTLNKTTSFDLSGGYFSPTADAFYIAYERYHVNIMLQKTFFKKQFITRIYVNDLFNTLNYRIERPFETFTTTRDEKWRTRQLRFWLIYRFQNKNKVNKRANQSKNEARRRL